MTESFMDAYRAGRATAADIDDWIDRWHDGPIVELDLHDFLGLTWTEFKHWGKTGKLPSGDGREAALRALCAENMAPDVNGRMIDVDTLWPSQVLAILDGEPEPG